MFENPKFCRREKKTIYRSTGTSIVSVPNLTFSFSSLSLSHTYYQCLLTCLCLLYFLQLLPAGYLPIVHNYNFSAFSNLSTSKIYQENSSTFSWLDFFFEMDVWEKEYNSEDTQEAEFKAVVNDENSEPVEEIPDGDRENSEKLDTDLDPVGETELSLDLTKPVESLSEEFTRATENPVQIEQSLDESHGGVIGSMSKGIDSWLGHNGFSEPTPDHVSKGVEPALDENNEVSSFVMDALSKETPLPDSVAVDLVSNQLVTGVPKSEDVGTVEDSDVPQVPHSTEHTTCMATTPRTSWRDCCGLFQILRRSDQ